MIADPTPYDQMLKRLKAGAKGEEEKNSLKETRSSSVSIQNQ